MTSEIVLMNRRAIALAADSATTTKYYDSNEREWRVRYFKGANKIFNLSRNHPIGLMTFDSANIQGVPWELIAKAYRDHLGSTEYNHVSDYARGLFDFMQSHGDLFPSVELRERFKDRAAEIGVILVAFVISSSPYSKARNVSQKKTAITKGLDLWQKQIKNSALIDNVEADEVKEAVEEHKDEVLEKLKNDQFMIPHLKVVDTERLAELAINGYFAAELPGHETTGLAFAGYGKNEYFPVVHTYTSYGVVRGRSVYSEDNEKKVSQSNIAQIVPLAKSEMVRTFIYGLSVDALEAVKSAFVKSIDGFHDDLVKSHGLDASIDLKANKDKQLGVFGDELVRRMVDSHTLPLRRVVSSLPVGELAELAETLVAIESLKERMTTNEESVSGPIDVAVISKGDGFVWIKRKHYFERNLNPRFFVRLSGDTEG